MKRALLFLIVVLSIAACRRYDENPFISFRSPEKRLCKKWYLKELTNQNDSAYTVDKNTTITFDKSGVAYFHYYFEPMEKYLTDTNQWRFIDNKKSIEITRKDYQRRVITIFDSIIYYYDTTIVYDTIFINRLTNKDFWFIWHDNHSPTKYFNYKYSSEK